MAGINNNLYPPLVDTYMPAFIYTDGCRVYFSISRYNSLSEMHHPGTDVNTVNAVQIVVQNQKTNQSMLNQELYPSGIKLADLKIDEDRQGDDKYYIQLFPSDMENGFSLNEYYKVQIRFTSAAASNPPLVEGVPSTGKELDNWLSTNISCFSEWSTIVLIRGISMPILELKSFDAQAEITTFTLDDVVVAGKVYFENPLDSEILKSYRIYLYNQNDNLIQDSGDIYVDSNLASKQIKYFFNYEFESDSDIIYKLAIQIVTKNLYSWPVPMYYNFNVEKVNYTDLDARISSIKDDQGGRIGIHLENNNAVSNGLNIIIRRTDYKSDFKHWEDIYKFTSEPGVPLNFTWYDYTVESGVMYKYSAQLENSLGYRSTPVQLINPVMIVSEDIFLTAEGQQLKIRFDPQISSFSHSISETKQETIGSKYPFVRRNGSVNYKTFPLSGLITYFMDVRENLLNASKNSVYYNSASLYKKYNQDNNISIYRDEIYEKEFRKKVIEFLYKNNVKLFKSTAEGNILVKLMDITFTPNQTLNRMIYSFSCTAVEIDEYNLENLRKYKILETGSYSKNQEWLTNIFGQIYRPTMNIYNKTYDNSQNYEYTDRRYYKWQTFGTSDLIANDITEKYKKKASEGYITKVKYLKYLKIELSSKPYLIGFVNGVPYKANAANNTDGKVMGHIVLINGQHIVIGKNGIYELTDSHTEIYTLSFPEGSEQGAILYQAVTYQQEDIAKLAKSYSILTKIGQFWGPFGKNDSVYRRIVSKYKMDTSESESSTEKIKKDIQTIQGLRVQAIPGTVFYVRESQDSGLERHVMNQTGLLEFYNDKTVIQGMYFYGVHLDPALYPSSPREDEFVQVPASEKIIDVDDLDLKNFKPKPNRVYTMTYNAAKKLRNLDIQMSSRVAQQIIPSGLADGQEQLLGNVADGAIISSGQDGIIIDPATANWVNESGYGQGLDEQQANILNDNLYQQILTNYSNNTLKCIFYHGGWFAFTDDGTNDVIMRFIQGVVDYYCKILIRRY